MAALERIAGDVVARRELLWLRAMEKEDYDMADSLDESEPGMARRLYLWEAGLADAETLRGMRARDRYALLWDLRYEVHAPELALVQCECGGCLEEDRAGA